MADTLKKDYQWLIHTNDNGTTPTVDAQLATLMDIRDELKEINRVLACRNFQDIPWKLDAIKSNTAKPKRKRKGAK